MEISIRKCSTAQRAVIDLMFQARNKMGVMVKKLMVTKMLMNWPMSRVKVAVGGKQLKVDDAHEEDSIEHEEARFFCGQVVTHR